ncbi:MAG: hypothetical protein ABI896_06615 [Actinomycetota bacterium]
MGEQLQCAANRKAERSRIHGICRALFEEERDLQRVSPRRCEARQDVVEDVVEEISQPHVSEAVFGLDRSR